MMQDRKFCVPCAARIRHSSSRHDMSHTQCKQFVISAGCNRALPTEEDFAPAEFGYLSGVPSGGMVEVSSNHHASPQESFHSSYYTYKYPLTHYLLAFGSVTLQL